MCACACACACAACACYFLEHLEMWPFSPFSSQMLCLFVGVLGRDDCNGPFAPIMSSLVLEHAHTRTACACACACACYQMMAGCHVMRLEMPVLR